MRPLRKTPPSEALRMRPGGRDEETWAFLAENLEALDSWVHRLDLWIHRAKSAVGRRKWPPRRSLKRPGRGRR